MNVSLIDLSTYLPGEPLSADYYAQFTDSDDLPEAMQSALDADGPSVVSVECATDEIPPFAPFLAQRVPKLKVVNGAAAEHHLPTITIRR